MTRVERLLDDLIGLQRPLLVALDVDGTLAPIVRDPDLARIPEPTLATLAALAKLPRVELALVTGRDLQSLKRMEQLDGVWRAVEHGAVVLGPGETPGPRQLPPSRRAALDQFRDWAAANAHGAFIEDKPQAVALHVRAIAADDANRATRLMDEADALARRLGLHVRRGKAVREAEAVPHDKARALAEIQERSGARSVFFVGDDLTDFPAIELAAARGIGAFVRSDEQRGTPSPSAFVFDDLDEVAEVLSELRRRVTP